jgi:NhaC family Na+:H+ antiporter
MAGRGEVRPPLGLGAALVPVGALILLVALSFVLFGDEGAKGPSQIAIVLAALVTVLVGWRHGIPIDAMREAAVASVSTGISAIFILFAVGSLIGTWAMSGTLIAMVYYGLELLSPDYFYATAAVLCGLVAATIGSSWTTIGTVGVGLVGIAGQMELSPAVTAGAIVSGAYFGDKTSPLSDSVNLAAAATGAKLYDHIRETLWTSLPTLLLALVLFSLLGARGDFDASEEIERIGRAFPITPWLFLPLLLVLGMAVAKVPPFTAIFLGALAGGVLAVVVAPERVVALADDPELPTVLALLKGVWLALANGYQSSTGDPVIDQLLSRGGMDSMLGTIWLIIAALAFGGLVERIGVLERLITPLVALARSTGALVAAVVGTVIGTNIVAADQYIAIVLPGRMFKQAFADRGYAPVVLSRAIGDTGTVTSAIVPWNSCGAFVAATLAVPTLDLLPYAFFNILSPLVTIAIAVLGFRMVRAEGAARASSPRTG